MPHELVSFGREDGKANLLSSVKQAFYYSQHHMDLKGLPLFVKPGFKAASSFKLKGNYIYRFSEQKFSMHCFT